MRLFPPPRFAIADDTAAIVVFAVIGNVSHHGDVSARGLARDVLPLLGGWLVAGMVFGLYAGMKFRVYRQPALWRLFATWLVGVTAGVAVRAAVLNHTAVGKEASFLAVALVFTLLFALAARVLTVWALRRAQPRTRRRASP
jgi:uncharacterized membrane protein AbrB (regulator of aidB expression)